MTFFNNAQQKFFRLGLIVSLFVFLGKLISFGRELSFSYFYGSSIYVESFFFNFNIMNLLAGIFEYNYFLSCSSIQKKKNFIKFRKL